MALIFYNFSQSQGIPRNNNIKPGISSEILVILPKTILWEPVHRFSKYYMRTENRADKYEEYNKRTVPFRVQDMVGYWKLIRLISYMGNTSQHGQELWCHELFIHFDQFRWRGIPLIHKLIKSHRCTHAWNPRRNGNAGDAKHCGLTNSTEIVMKLLYYSASEYN
jgi:hypothetical protein